MQEEEKITFDILGVKVTSNKLLPNIGNSLRGELSKEVIRRCYQRALQYMVFGGLPDDMKVGVERRGEEIEVRVCRDVFFAHSDKHFWMELKIDCCGKSSIHLNSDLAGYVLESSKAGKLVSFFSVEESKDE
jgi:hypothetical protein